MSAPAIRVTNLTKYFGFAAAVNDVTFDVGSGETVVLWGANGAGKTTVVRCLLGIMPYVGQITVCGADVRLQGKYARRRMGYVPQEIRLYDTQTVREAAQFYAALRGLRVVDDRLAAWGLSDVAARRIGKLSGGMKQRLVLALALLADPPVLVLDEPTSNLDVEARRALLGYLEQCKRSSKTLVLCSHQADEVWRLADRVIVLEAGRMVQEGRPETVDHRPALDFDVSASLSPR
jgi:ABC-type multidrug transport system ATPase subunit